MPKSEEEASRKITDVKTRGKDSSEDVLARPRSHTKTTLHRLVSRLEDHPSCRAFPLSAPGRQQWLVAVFVPSHGCGPAPDLHRTSQLFPCIKGTRRLIMKSALQIKICQEKGLVQIEGRQVIRPLFSLVLLIATYRINPVRGVSCS